MGIFDQFLKALCAVMFLSISGAVPVHAQLGGLLGGLTGADAGSSPASAGTFISAYGESKYLAKDADSKLFQALGDKVNAAKSAEEAESLKSGMTDAELLGKALKTQSHDDPLKSAENITMDADSKVVYVEGLISLAKAVVKAKEATGMASGVASSLAGNPLTMGATAKATLSIAKDAPSHLKNLGSALNNAVQFAKDQGIDVPADVTNVL